MTAYNSLIYTMWTQCGDTQIANAHYANIASLLNYEAQRANSSGIGQMFTSYGDWCPPPAVPGGGQGPKPPGSLVSAAAFLADIGRAIELATALGHSSDAAAWTNLLNFYTTVRVTASVTAWLEALPVARVESFTPLPRCCTRRATGHLQGYNNAFYQSSISAYGNANGNGLQTANAASLHMGLVPAGNVAAVAAALANDLTGLHGGHWGTGIFGMKYLVSAAAA